MLKNSKKPKKAVKGNHNILSYFSKITHAQDKSTAAVKKPSNAATNAIIISDSDEDDFVAPRATPSILEPITNLPKCSDSIPEPCDGLSTPPKKRKYSRENTPSPDIIPCSIDPKQSYASISSLRKKKSKSNGMLVENFASGSKVDCVILSPSKNNSDLRPSLRAPSIRCKSSEELFDGIARPLFKSIAPEEAKSNALAADLAPNKSETEKVLKGRETPEKNNVQPVKQKSSEKKTPGKKLAPTKLFRKSPRLLQKFNVQVMEDFVTVTPRKSSEEKDLAMSPKSSARSAEVQQRNESTPKKSPAKRSPNSRVSKIKTKLNFGAEAPLESLLKENSAENGVSSDRTTSDGKSDDTASLNVNVDSSENFNGDLKGLLDDSWDEDLNQMNEQKPELDLTESQHCRIMEIEAFRHYIVLMLQSTKDKATAICRVEGFWTATKFAKGDTVHISAVFDKNKCMWIVSNDCGLIVFEPDRLISTTSVVGALFCKRRSVLQERYRGFDPSNKIMIVGILVHKLLQEALRMMTSNYGELEVIIKKLLLAKDTLWSCYESSLTLDEIEKELIEFIPRIISFMKQYVRKTPNSGWPVNKEDWHGTIDTIQDIEENLWCPELGVKGKVDVSVQSGAVMRPLEVKTGRATVSLEHRGQVILYIMMMDKFGYTVPSGLLLYLRESVLREIPMSRREKRDLIVLRNQLTYYLMQKPRLGNGSSSSDNTDGSNLSVLFPSELPEPINHHRACGNCPYNVVCCTYLRYENYNLANNPLEDLQSELLAHLTPAHLEYFLEWSSLLALEDFSSGPKQVHEIYTVPPKEREKKGQCIIDVTVKSVVTECGTLFKHTFKKVSDCAVNFSSSGIGEGNYVVVSTDARPAVASGIVTLIDHQSITVSLDRDLNKKYSKAVFHIDMYSSTMSQTFNMTNLSLLLEASDQAGRLRELIVDKRPPTFKKILPKALATRCTPLLKKLNRLQQKAVFKAVGANDYLLIKGMPGTGKTATIVSLIQVFVELEKSVLITSHTHSAVDNVCIKLLERGISVLRLGAESRINPKVHSCSEDAFTRHCVKPEQLDEVYNGARVLAVTCLGSGHPALSRRRVDICIVDESTQVMQCSVFRALYVAKKFILVGDPDQLAPVVRNVKAVKRGLAVSLFERLVNPEATVTLNLNYRMNKPITALANALTYEGGLLVANDAVANATLQLASKEDVMNLYSSQSWMRRILDDGLESSVWFLDTGPVWNKKSPNRSTNHKDRFGDQDKKCLNEFEAVLVLAIIKALLKGGIVTESIGIISPYRAQVNLLAAMLKSPIEVSTVDQYQGRDKDVIIYTCSKSCHLAANLDREFEILEDKRRLTVAITRARHKLIIIGDVATVTHYSPFVKLLSRLDEKNVMKLEDGQDDFSWGELFEET